MNRKLLVPLFYLLCSIIGYSQEKDSIPPEKFDHLKERGKTKYNFIPLPSYDPSTKFGLNIMNMFTYYPNKEDLVSPASSGGFGGNSLPLRSS